MSIQSRILKIEEHVNEVLKNDLKNTLEAGDRIYEEISEYLQLRNLLEKMKTSGVMRENMKTMVDIGCNVYVKGVINSLDRINVSIGLGFYLECTHEEALKVINERINFLNERTVVYKKKANSLRARIKLLVEGLRKLQNLDTNHGDQGD